MAATPVELPADRPYPARVLHVLATRGSLLDTGKDLCVIEWADGQVQPVQLDAVARIDAVCVKQGETLEGPAIVALVTWLEESASKEQLAAPKSEGPSALAYLFTFGLALVLGWTILRVVRDAELSSSLSSLIVLGGGLALAFFLSFVRTRLGLLAGVVFGLAVLAAVRFDGGPQPPASWSEWLHARLAEPREAETAAAPASQPVETDDTSDSTTSSSTTPQRATMLLVGDAPTDTTGTWTPRTPAERLLDRHAWSVYLCFRQQSGCLWRDPATSKLGRRERGPHWNGLHGQMRALREAFPGLLTDARWEAQLARWAASSGHELRSEEFRCDPFTLEANCSPIEDAARAIVTDPSAWLTDLASQSGHPGSGDALRRLLRDRVELAARCMQLGVQSSDTELMSWTNGRAVDFDNAFPGEGLGEIYLSRGDSLAKEFRSNPSSPLLRDLATACRSFEQQSLLPLPESR
ncbi:MAG: hypothetical protein AAF533_02160 [Acidobacteriota bacterium]